MNPIKALKAQQKALQIQKKLQELKKNSIIDYKWYGLACCCGIVNDTTRLLDPFLAIQEAKELFGDLSEEQLDMTICSYKDAVKYQSEKVLGKFYTKQVLNEK